ncbi:MAG: dual OB domain-containing protein [Bryobacteraceae bacterium]
MATKQVLVVARTRMYGGKVCIGALSDAGENLRLMNQHCDSDLGTKSIYRVGEWWQVECEPCGTKTPPHVEDVSVAVAKKLGLQDNLAQYLNKATKPWKGPIDVLFDGKIRFTGNGGGYISPADVPAGATGFWIPDSPLTLDVDERDKRGYYNNHRHLSYVGTEEEVDVIPAGTLVRVSLARWWKPRDADPSFEERCYAQLSGWY